ncbi:MAG: hypothetical protein QNL70_03145 [Pseudomonas sp.]
MHGLSGILDNQGTPLGKQFTWKEMASRPMSKLDDDGGHTDIGSSRGIRVNG